MPYLGIYFKVWILPAYFKAFVFDYCQHPQICQNKFSCQNIKTLTLGQKCFWVICRLEFWRTIVTFDVSTFKYVMKQHFKQNKQFSNREPKMSYLCNFGLSVRKIIAMFEISTLKFIKMQSFVENWKFLNLHQKDTLWIFLGWNLKKLMSYFKSAPSSLSKYQKLSKTTTTITATTKNKTRNVLLGSFKLKIGKTYCDIWNQHPRICRNAKNCAKQRKSNLGPKCVI